jgi:hypothetical protein
MAAQNAYSEGLNRRETDHLFKRAGLAREWEYTAADHSLSLVNSSIRNNTGSNAHNRL